MVVAHGLKLRQSLVLSHLNNVTCMLLDGKQGTKFNMSNLYGEILVPKIMESQLGTLIQL